VKAERTADALAACEVSSVTRLFNFVEDPILNNVDMLWRGPVARLLGQARRSTLLVQIYACHPRHPSVF
jgi:hypothetical protein